MRGFSIGKDVSDLTPRIHSRLNNKILNGFGRKQQKAIFNAPEDAQAFS